MRRKLLLLLSPQIAGVGLQQRLLLTNDLLCLLRLMFDFLHHIVNNLGSRGLREVVLLHSCNLSWLVRYFWLVGTYMSPSETLCLSRRKGEECKACGGCIVGGLPFLPPSHPWTQSRTEKIYGGLWV